MNEGQKHFLKITGIVLAASIIGGIAAGLVTGCMIKHQIKKHIKEHKEKMQNFERHFERQGERRRVPEFQGRFIEEDYIVIPKNVIENLRKDPKPFDGPKPDRY